MDILRKYFSRLGKAWYGFVGLFLTLFELGRFTTGALILDSSPPWWESAFVVVFGVALFFLANLQVFRESEAEKRRLESYIDEIEDTRANIRFKHNKCWSDFPSYHKESPFPDLKLELNQQPFLDESGLPGWVRIGADLKGEKKSDESGELVWEMVEANLPPIFAIDESNKGSFQWMRGGGLPIEKIKDWKDDFDAVFELPLRIADREDPHRFARTMRTLGSYRIVINYHTLRGIDSESKSHSLILEGDFQELRDQLCEAWKGWGFAELAELADCQQRI